MQFWTIRSPVQFAELLFGRNRSCHSHPSRTRLSLHRVWLPFKENANWRPYRSRNSPDKNSVSTWLTGYDSSSSMQIEWRNCYTILRILFRTRAPAVGSIRHPNGFGKLRLTMNGAEVDWRGVFYCRWRSVRMLVGYGEMFRGEDLSTVHLGMSFILYGWPEDFLNYKGRYT